ARLGAAAPPPAGDLPAGERVAPPAAAGLPQGPLPPLLDRPPQPLAPEQPCPAGGRLCPVHYEDRTLTVAGGQPVTHHEPVCHGPDCRRDFFPPADPAPPG